MNHYQVRSIQDAFDAITAMVEEVTSERDELAAEVMVWEKEAEGLNDDLQAAIARIEELEKEPNQKENETCD